MTDAQLESSHTVPAGGLASYRALILGLGLVGGTLGFVLIDSARYAALLIGIGTEGYFWWAWPWPVYGVVLLAGLMIRRTGAIAATSAAAAVPAFAATFVESLLLCLPRLRYTGLSGCFPSPEYPLANALGAVFALAVVAGLGELLGRFLWKRPNNLDRDLLLAVPALLGGLYSPQIVDKWNDLAYVATTQSGQEFARVLTLTLLKPGVGLLMSYPVAFLGLVLMAFLTCGLLPAAIARAIATARKRREAAAAVVASFPPGMAPPPPIGGTLPDHPSATPALVLGILGVVGIGIAAPIAWVLAARARTEIAQQPGRYRSSGSIQVGYVLGIIGTVLLVIGFLILVFTLGTLLAHRPY